MTIVTGRRVVLSAVAGIVFLLSATILAAQLPITSSALAQSLSPVRIGSYEASIWSAQLELVARLNAEMNREELTIAALESRKTPVDRNIGDIVHTLILRNFSERKIVAVEVGLLSFDVFDDLLDSSRAIEIGVIEPTNGSLSVELSRTPLRDGYSLHTAMTFVRRVRFENGEIWNADLEQIIVSVKGRFGDFDASVLTSPDPEPPPSKQ